MKLNNIVKVLVMSLLFSNITFASGFLSDIDGSEVTAESIVTDSEINLLGDLELGELIDEAYDSVDLINKALNDRLEYQYAGRISFLHEKSLDIIEKSEVRTDEALLRISLRRTGQIGREVLTIMGKNNEENLRWLSHFYKNGFESAARLINANYMLVGDLQYLDEYDSSKRYLTSAEFGRMEALRLWEYTSGLESDASKAILLVRLVSYLGTDLKNDLRRREAGIAKSLADIYYLQKSASYKKVVRSIQAGVIPERDDVAKLRRSIYTLIMEFNNRF